MSRSKPKISVITTFYNDENTILFALQSVLSNIIPDDITVEYIIINDCSTDNSPKFVQTVVDKVKKPNINCEYFTTPENLGCGGARKFGISKATGDYFMFLDADDYYISNTFISRAYNDIVRTEADIVEYGVVDNFMDGTKHENKVDKEYILTDKRQIMKVMLNDGIIKFYVWSKIYKKDIVDSKEYSDARTFEDIRTTPFWIYNCNKIAIMPSAEINYRANEKSIVRNNNIEARKGTVSALFELMQNMPIDYAWDIYNRALVDLTAIMDGHTSDDPGFNELSKYNTEMLKILFPNDYESLTFNLPEDTVKENNSEANTTEAIEQQVDTTEEN